MSKSALELEDFLNKNWLKLGIKKAKRKGLQHKLAAFIKAAKNNLKCYINYFKKIADYNRFSSFYYFQCNETYFQFVIIVVKFFLTASCCQRAVQKLYNIIIGQLTIKN